MTSLPTCAGSGFCWLNKTPNCCCVAVPCCCNPCKTGKTCERSVPNCSTCPGVRPRIDATTAGGVGHDGLSLELPLDFVAAGTVLPGTCGAKKSIAANNEVKPIFFIVETSSILRLRHRRRAVCSLEGRI